MNHREELQEQYEEALFALLLDEIAEEEGRKLLEENERLNLDPDAAVPEELEQKCRKLIRNAYRKKRGRTIGKVSIKVIQRVAVAVFVSVLLFAVAYAAIPEVRVGTLNLILKVAEDHTDLQLQHTGDSGSHNPYTDVTPYTLPHIPNEYGMLYSREEQNSRIYWYETEKGEILQIAIDAGNEHTSYGVDTEDANVTNVTINEYAGICAEKNGTVQVAWADTGRAVFFSIYSTAYDKDHVLELARAIKYAETFP